MTNHDKLVAAFVEALGLPPDMDVTELAYRKHAGWSSIGHMQLISMIETKFDVMLETEDVIAMSTFRAAIGILERLNVSFEV